MVNQIETACGKITSFADMIQVFAHVVTGEAGFVTLEA